MERTRPSLSSPTQPPRKKARKGKEKTPPGMEEAASKTVGISSLKSAFNEFKGKVKKGSLPKSSFDFSSLGDTRWACGEIVTDYTKKMKLYEKHVFGLFATLNFIFNKNCFVEKAEEEEKGKGTNQNTTETSSRRLIGFKTVEDYSKRRRADSQLPMFYFTPLAELLLLSEVSDVIRSKNFEGNLKFYQTITSVENESTFQNFFFSILCNVFLIFPLIGSSNFVLGTKTQLSFPIGENIVSEPDIVIEYRESEKVGE